MGRVKLFTYPPNVVQSLDFGGEATVNAEELLVHESRQRKTVECIHAGVVHLVVVLYSA